MPDLLFLFKKPKTKDGLGCGDSLELVWIGFGIEDGALG